MGTNYKAALIPQRIRETIHGWGKAARRRRRRHGLFADDSTVHTDTSTVLSVEEYENRVVDSPRAAPDAGIEIELQPPAFMTTDQSPVANETSSRIGTPPLPPSASISSTTLPTSQAEGITRSSLVPVRSE